MKDYEHTFKDFWRDLVTRNGRLNADLVKRELHDFAELMERVGKVYDHVTGGRISKPNTDADVVISEHDDVCERQFYGIVHDDLADLLPRSHAAILRMSSKEMRGVLADVLDYVKTLRSK